MRIIVVPALRFTRKKSQEMVPLKRWAWCPALKKELGKHEQAWTPSYKGAQVEKKKSESSGFISTVSSIHPTAVSTTPTHSGTGVVAKDQPSVVEMATTVSWFEPLSARPATETQSRRFWSALMLYLGPVCLAIICSHCAQKKRGTVVLASHLHRQRKVHISSALNQFSVWAPQCLLLAH